jgi:hypothetical protein
MIFNALLLCFDLFSFLFVLIACSDEDLRTFLYDCVTMWMILIKAACQFASAYFSCVEVEQSMINHTHPIVDTTHWSWKHWPVIICIYINSFAMKDNFERSADWQLYDSCKFSDSEYLNKFLLHLLYTWTYSTFLTWWTGRSFMTTMSWARPECLLGAGANGKLYRPRL